MPSLALTLLFYFFLGLGIRSCFAFQKVRCCQPSRDGSEQAPGELGDVSGPTLHSALFFQLLSHLIFFSLLLDSAITSSLKAGNSGCALTLPQLDRVRTLPLWFCLKCLVL